MLDFKKFYKPIEHMNLALFDELERYNGVHNGHLFISSNEESILNSYHKIKQLLTDQSLESVNVVAHCGDQAIASQNLSEKLNEIKKDLALHKKFKFVLIAAAPYHWKIDFSDFNNFLYIYYPEYQGIYWPIYKDQIPLTGRPIKKHFLSLNKRADLYRQLLYYTFYQNNWIDKSYFSYLGEDYLKGNLYSIEKFEQIHNNIDKFFPGFKRPPNRFITLDDDKNLEKYKTFSQSEFDPTWNIDEYLYKDSFCSVVIETAPTHEIVNLSEKTFRSIVYGHPVVLFAAPGSYAFLRDLGIDFGIYDIAAVNWDSGVDNKERFLNFIEFLKKIAVLSHNNLELVSRLVDNKTDHLRDQYRYVYKRMLSAQPVIAQSIKDFLLSVPFKF